MEVPSYLSRLLSELNEQRKRDFFCDCSIIVEGRVFKAHRNILFASSGYFRTLLVHYLQDNGQRHSTASLDIVTAEAFSFILDFLYSGRLDLRSNNVIEIMSAASYLQMTDVVNFCKGYIKSSLEICNRERDRHKDLDDRENPVSATSAPVASTSDADQRTCQVTEALSPDDAPTAAVCTPVATSSKDSEGENSQGAFPNHPPMNVPLKISPGPDLVNSSTPGLLLGLVHPKIEYDPDEEGESSRESKDTTLYQGPNQDEERTVNTSPAPSTEHSSVSFANCPMKQFPDVLFRAGMNPNPNEHFSQSLGYVGGFGRGEDVLGPAVHRSTWPIVCKGCRQVFSGIVSQGMKRFGLCDGCTFVTTTNEDPSSMNLSIQSESMEKGNRDSEWPVFMVEGVEAEASASTAGKDDKQNVAKQLAENGTLL
ncbi:hypothetical protein cypCar_00036604 [Cyprinus carpio]|nr:hypothetical protein cypCar_00036604 [Cyprinus carpio]